MFELLILFTNLWAWGLIGQIIALAIGASIIVFLMWVLVIYPIAKILTKWGI